ncbi:MAG TPA: cell division protein FtsL [Hyphomicrobiaceae bacterium]|nr:cell division protein FtsL [Hyphomicrobiaceae bacterium]
MLRFLAVAAMTMAMVSAFALYSINTGTRKIVEQVEDQQQKKEALISSIAILRAERAFRARPEVIEPLARKLGMAPVRGDQYVPRSVLQVSKQ